MKSLGKSHFALKQKNISQILAQYFYSCEYPLISNITFQVINYR